MNTPSDSLSGKLASAGRALYGERWQTPLSQDLGVADRTLRRWLNGEAPIPETIDNELRDLLLKRLNEVGGLIKFTINPTEKTVFHHPTLTCFRYDESGQLTVLYSPTLGSDQYPLILRGAEESLRQERERDPRLAGFFTDPQTGEVQLPYKGYVISYPRVRMNTAHFTVNLASNEMGLQAKLGNSSLVFNDATLEGAIAQAKRHVDNLG